MNKVIFNGFLIIIVLFGACQTPIDLDDDDLIPAGDIPPSALDFINDQYGDYQIEDVGTEDFCDDQFVYNEVELEDGQGPDIDLYFDQAWNFILSGIEISEAELPALVRQKIDSYPDYSLEEDELEQLNYADGTVRYKVELSHSSEDNDLELIIDQDGSLFCIDDDESEDDDSDGDDNGDDDGDDHDDDDDDGDNDDDDYDNDDIDADQIPGSVLSFIRENYAGYEIEEVEKEDLCEDDYYFEIELEDGQDEDKYLYFSLEWEFLFEKIEIDADDLPSTVVDAINEEYPGAEIEEDDVYQLMLSNGTIQYMVELDEASDSDLEIIFDENGDIICIDD